ncbi:MAG: hypothetical protein DHS20C08_25060 [Rhodomicrobium sp.]|nr:MAG: hypothetical protein DHS20C08_25060 [Rhodomicrobium sp.]
MNQQENSNPSPCPSSTAVEGSKDPVDQTNPPPTSLGRQLMWFILFWGGGIAALGAVSLILKAVLSLYYY